MSKLVVIGAGGMATNIVDFFNLEEQVIAYFDAPKYHGEELYGIPVLEFLPSKPDLEFISVMGLCREKYKLIELAQRQRLNPRWANLIHPQVFMAKSVTVGEGVMIQPNTNIYSRVNIGNHVLVCGGTRIGHDSVIGDYSTLCPEVAIAGNVTLGRGVFVGINATIRDGIRVGNGATIGAGAVVVEDVAEDSKVVGNPARRITGHKERWNDLERG